MVLLRTLRPFFGNINTDIAIVKRLQSSDLDSYTSTISKVDVISSEMEAMVSFLQVSVKIQ